MRADDRAKKREVLDDSAFLRHPSTAHSRHQRQCVCTSHYVALRSSPRCSGACLARSTQICWGGQADRSPQGTVVRRSVRLSVWFLPPCMSSPASKPGSAATSPAGAGQGGGSGPTVTPTASAAAAPAKDKEESSFSRWKKKYRHIAGRAHREGKEDRGRRDAAPSTQGREQQRIGGLTQILL